MFLPLRGVFSDFDGGVVPIFDIAVGSYLHHFAIEVDDYLGVVELEFVDLGA